MKNYFLLYMLLTLFACKHNELLNPENTAANICGVTDPLRELPWLKAQLDSVAAAQPTDYCSLWQITQGTYQNQIVYIIVVGGPLCCTCAGNAVYNCAGELVFVCNPKEEAKIRDKKVIWERG